MIKLKKVMLLEYFFLVLFIVEVINCLIIYFFVASIGFRFF